MDRLERLVVILILTLLVLIFATPARAAEWNANSDFLVAVDVASISEIPVPMPAGMIATVANGHRAFEVRTSKTTVHIYLSPEILKMDNERGAAISLDELESFNQNLKGLKTLLVEAEKKGLSIWEFELNPAVKKPFFRMSADGGEYFAHRLVGNFADEGQRKLALSVLGAESSSQKK
jgi:hypothetical protein